jgi:putative oxidoreductase
MHNHPRPDLFAPILRNDALMGPVLLLARFMMTGIFLYYTLNVFTKLPAPGLVVWAAVAAQTVGVVFIVLGYETRLGALLLAVCILVSLSYRGHFGFDNFVETIGQKDLAVAGGFLFMFAFGPGPWSLDGARGGSRLFSSAANNPGLVGPLLVLGRLMSIVVFCFFGVSKILHTARIQSFMVRHNPHVPTVLVYPAIVVQLVPSLMVLLGFKTRYAALLLSGFCIIAPALFWSDFRNPSQLEQFLLDFATAPGLLFMFANGPGPLSIDARAGATAR